jgi:hypothetical protein
MKSKIERNLAKKKINLARLKLVVHKKRLKSLNKVRRAQTEGKIEKLN